MHETALHKSSAPARSVHALAFLRFLLPLFLAVRVAYAAKLLLVPDESFYWLLSRHLAAGYFDHPPMIALLIRLGTLLAGTTELGVRLIVVLMSAGALGIIVAVANKVLHDSRAAVWVALMWLTSPLLAALGTIATPDTPATFFSVCGLAMIALIADRDDKSTRHDSASSGSAMLWILFGLFSGLAMVSKYTGVLLPAAVALALLFSAKGRKHYRKPWVYLSGIIALLVFSPVVWWNSQHGWASFLFQLHHGASSDESTSLSLLPAVGRIFKDLGIYLGEQCGVWTPVLFAVGMAALVEYWLRFLLPMLQPRFGQIHWIKTLSAKPPISQLDRVLLWSASVPLLLFGLANLRAHHTEANWPGFAYFPLSLLTTRWLMEKWDGRRVEWARAGIRVALVALIGMHVIVAPPVTRAMLRLPYRFPHALQDLTGWPQYGRWLSMLSGETNAPVITNRHQDAGEASFYMTGHPDVWCISVGSRPTSFDYFDEPPNFAKIPQLIWVGSHSELFCKQYGYAEVQRSSLTIFQGHYPRGYVAILLARQPR